jgi:hypothetical protein
MLEKSKFFSIGPVSLTKITLLTMSLQARKDIRLCPGTRVGPDEEYLGSRRQSPCSDIVRRLQKKC